MTHTALARKYRPLTFAGVATQEHVSDTLRRAVATGRVGHAYLFSGPRGVGKTTLARVLAMALNCPDRGEDGEPCGACDDCRRIWEGATSLDVVEIDAASNRGVDDARDLRERAMYAPSDQDRHKVYIVDEAHMLTREAWNALLKILEEPPPRVHFIFATTEPQKIEQTAAPILSRCQRFDFRRIAPIDIVSRVKEVLDREDITASDEALLLIAKKANGGMRDALSLADQVLALSDGPVTADTVRRVLGVVGDDQYLRLFDTLQARDPAGVFRLVESLMDEGFDLVEFYHGLVDALRALLRLRVEGDTAVSGVIVPERLDDWVRRAKGFEPGEMLRMLRMAAELEVNGSLRRTQQPQVLLELLLLRFVWLDRTVEIETLIRAAGGEAPRSMPKPTSVSGSVSEPVSRSAPEPEPSIPEPATPEAELATPEPSTPEAEPAAVISEPVDASEPEVDANTDAPSAPAEPGIVDDAPTESAASDTEPATNVEPATDAEIAAADPESADPIPDPPSPEPPPPAVVEPAVAWRELLAAGAGLPAGLTPFLRAAKIREVDEGLEVALPPGPALERLRAPEVADTVQRALRERASSDLTIVFIEDDSVTPATERISSTAARQGRLDDLLEREPLLRDAVEALDLEPVD